MPRHELPPTIGLDEAARWLGLSYESARQRAKAGRFPGAFQIGTRWRVSRRAILREIERLAGLGAHEPVVAPMRPNQPQPARVPAAPPDGSRGDSALTSSPRFIAASEPSLVRRRRQP
jgi:hypothetical protein